MRAMFSTVAPRYDFITRTFSYGMDRHWKRTGLDRAKLPDRPVVLDLAAGTGDFSLMVQPALPRFARRRRRYHRAHAATGARARRAAHRLRRCRPASLPGPLIRLRLRRLRPAQFPQPQSCGAARSSASPAPAARWSAWISSCLPTPCCARSISAYLYAQGAFWGTGAARPPARLHLHPRLAAKLSSPSTISPHCCSARATSRWMPAVTSWAASGCTGPSKSKLVAGIHQPG